MEAPLILASASPRRAELLRMLRIPFRVDPSTVEERARPGEPAEAQVLRFAEEKALQVSRRSLPDALVLGGDTDVLLDGRVLGKPRDAEDAVRTLLSLAGRTHAVLSGLALARGGEIVFSGTERTHVTFRPLREAEIRSYVASGEPMDKAGSYGIQGMGAALVRGIEGDHSNVVGLPLPLLLKALARAGRSYHFGEPAPVR